MSRDYLNDNNRIVKKRNHNKIKNTLDTSKIWSKIVNNKSEELCLNGIRRITILNGKKITKIIKISV